VQAAPPPQLAHQVAVDDAELEAELVAHLVAPLDLQARGADDQHGPGAVAQQELLDDQAGLDGLAEADVVGDEQADPRHLQGASDGVELVVLDRDAAAERRVQETSAEATAPQRTASRKASSRRGGSKGRPLSSGRAGAGSGSVERSWIRAPGSISQRTESSSPRPSSSIAWRVTRWWAAPSSKLLRWSSGMAPRSTR
jgi:hypothetical protein